MAPPASTTSTARQPAMDSMAHGTRAGESRLRGRAVAGSRGVRAFHNRETPRPRDRATAENGFTLAGVLVIMTIMMIFVAYTVPRQWSTIMKRERERETI